jgi:Flp pilus assembly protein TadD
MPLLKPRLAWLFALLALPLLAQPFAVPTIAQAGTVSAELLRYPLSDKAVHMLQKAFQLSGAGEHAGAVKQLEKILDRCPEADAYVYSLLGVEYLKTGQISEAVNALERAVRLLPHDASNHANLGVGLVCKGQYDRAERELKRALDLDAHNAVASQLLGELASNQTAQK